MNFSCIYMNLWAFDGPTGHPRPQNENSICVTTVQSWFWELKIGPTSPEHGVGSGRNMSCQETDSNVSDVNVLVACQLMIC